jgi:hypothetical protein
MHQSSTWRAFRAALSGFVHDNLHIVQRPGLSDQQAFARRFHQNTRTLELLGLMTERNKERSTFLLSLIGCGDWTQQSMLYVAVMDNVDDAVIDGLRPRLSKAPFLPCLTTVL